MFTNIINNKMIHHTFFKMNIYAHFPLSVGIHLTYVHPCIQVLPNLRMIKLKNLQNLMKTPDFKGLPNLETFMVYSSTRLEEIHPSFGQNWKSLFL